MNWNIYATINGVNELYKQAESQDAAMQIVATELIKAGGHFSLGWQAQTAADGTINMLALCPSSDYEKAFVKNHADIKVAGLTGVIISREDRLDG